MDPNNEFLKSGKIENYKVLESDDKNAMRYLEILHKYRLLKAWNNTIPSQSQGFQDHGLTGQKDFYSWKSIKIVKRKTIPCWLVSRHNQKLSKVSLPDRKYQPGNLEKLFNCSFSFRFSDFVVCKHWQQLQPCCINAGGFSLFF